MKKLFAFFGRREEGGQAIVLIAISALGMLFAVGLAIDSGQLFNGRRTAQEAADAAAWAGAVVRYQNGTAVEAVAAGTADALLNGYTLNVPTSGTTVTVTSPPSAGSYNGNPACVMAVISTPVRTSLVPQQSGLTTVKATGVACSVSNNLGYAIMALDQQCDDGTAALSSNGSFAVHGGGIEINSCSATAGNNDGVVTLDSGYYTDVVGSVSGTWPNLRTGQAVRPDPFAGLAKPSTNGLNTYSPACSPTINQPGIYVSDFQSNCDYVFAPGTYILKGSGFDLTGNSSACTGSTCVTPSAAGGVFFFITNANYPATGGGCASQTFKIEGGNTTTLSAPTSGTYQGMLLWQDSVCTGNLNIGGGGSIFSTGTIYAPTANVVGNGNNAVVNVSQVVSKRIDSQNADFTITYSNALTYQGYIPALVE